MKHAARICAVVSLSVALVASEAQAMVRYMRAPAWTKIVTMKSPRKRAAFAMAYDPVSRKVVIFGGYTATGYLNDTWTFDGTSWAEEHPKVAPAPRAASNMAFDARTKTLVMFGGYNGSLYLGDTWMWDGATSQWTAVQPKRSPTPVTGPAVFSDPLDGRADVFGGFDGTFYHTETWRLGKTTWRQLKTSIAPYGRSAMVFGTDPKTMSTVVFGGLGDVNPDNTWTWNGSAWAQQSPSAQPPVVYDSAAAYDAKLAAVVKFGGGNGGVDFADTWSWNGATWMQLAPTSSPSVRESHGMAYDAALGHVVLFGGIYFSKGVYFNDTWELTP